MKKYLFIYLKLEWIIILFAPFLILGNNNLHNSSYENSHQVQEKFSDSIYLKTGSYKQMLNAVPTKLSAGDKIKISHYISGNGFIDHNTVKLTQTVSFDNFYNPEESYVIHSIKLDPNGDITFGAEESKLKKGFNAITFRSGYLVDSVSLNMFTRIHEVNTKITPIPGFIFSEAGSFGSGKYESTMLNPIEWHIKTNDELQPGNYYFTFNLTYFDGIQWQTDIEKLEIHVMYWYEKNENWLQLLAIIVAIYTIFPIFTCLFKLPLSKKMRSFLKRKFSKVKILEGN